MTRHLLTILAFVSATLAVLGAPVPSRYYHIVNAVTGYALSNNQSELNDARVVLVSNDKSKWGQVWEFRAYNATEHVFILVNPYCEKSIDLNPNKDFLLQWNYSPTNVNQRFYVVDEEDGLVRLLNNDRPQNNSYDARSRYLSADVSRSYMTTDAADPYTYWRLEEVSLDDVTYPSETTNPWENQRVFGLNKEEPHATFIPYPTTEALRADSETFNHPWVTPSHNDSYLSLNGRWKFRYSPSPEQRPGEEFYGDNVNSSSWADIDVPGCWEMYGYDKPLYINVDYLFADNPPYISHSHSGTDPNPVGSYRRHFNLPVSWDNQRVFLHFDGLYSGAFVWINGKEVGYTQGGNNDAEFDITPYVHPGDNNISVQVIRWTDASYLEGQDMWHMTGLHRDVYLYATPLTFLRDHSITASLSTPDYGSADVNVNLQFDNRDALAVDKRVKLTVLDPSGNVCATTTTDVSIPEGETSATASVSLHLSDILPWTAETPSLYTFIFEQSDAAIGSTEMAFRTKFGLRDIRIVNNQVLINGRRVFFRGVNTQDTHPVLGRSIDVPTMLRDITLMKQANVNTVRTSHYPRQAKMYAMFDHYGLYVMNEADVECHKNWSDNGAINNSNLWTPQWIDRTLRMVYRDRNHPSVIFWSLGNESGYGSNLEKSYDAVRALDPTRPIHNCTGGGASPERISDLHSIMYPTLSALRSNANGASRPVFMCEYAHAMGNAIGNLREYWETIESNSRIIGGCIWDWVDQSVYAPADVIRWRSAAGNDSAPLTLDDGHLISGYDMPGPHQGNFLNNGIIGPTREWTPKLYEVRKAYQPVAIRLANAGNAVGASRPVSVSITSKLVFADLAQMCYLVYEEVTDGRVTKTSTPIDLASLVHTNASTWTLSTAVASTTEYLNLRLRLKSPTDWADAGYEVASEQLTIAAPATTLPALTTSSDAADALVLSTTPDTYVLASPRTRLVIGRTDGFIRSFNSNGVDVFVPNLQQPIYSNVLWVENDSPYGGINWGNRSATIDGASVSLPSLNAGAGLATFTVTASDDQCPYTIVYTLTNLGTLDMAVTYRPNASGLRRIGLDMRFPAGFERVDYYARGPIECYIDRADAAYVGRYSTTIDAMFEPYIHPQSCGNRLDMRELTLTDSSAQPRTITVTSEGTSFSLSHFAPTQYLTTQFHTYDLTRSADIYATFDYMQRGLGNGSCGATTESKYLCPSSGTYTQHLRLVGNDPAYVPDAPEPPADPTVPQLGKVYNITDNQTSVARAVYANDEGIVYSSTYDPERIGVAAAFLCTEVTDNLYILKNLVTGMSIVVPCSSEFYTFVEISDPREPEGAPVINFSRDAAIQHANRRLRGLQCGDRLLDLSTENRPYRDCRDFAINVRAGQRIVLEPDFYNPGAPTPWMHSYVYLDLDHDNIFTYHTDYASRTASGEIVSFSAFAFGGNSSNCVNSLGERVNWGNALTPPVFQAPEEIGNYTIRFKVDWDNLCPAGALPGVNRTDGPDEILANGGSITDFSLVVHHPADVNLDGIVNLDDLQAVCQLLLGSAAAYPEADLNNDGLITIADVALWNKLAQ